jgi:tetratricopeptide (TPR) repeat protein
MLYSIIPPALVVLSLAGIIVFLFKKSQKVAQLSLLEDKKNSALAVMPGRGSLGNANGKRLQNFKQAILVFLEKMTRRSRIIILKIENTFSGWSESLREKRKKHTHLNNSQESEGGEAIELNSESVSAEEKLKEYRFEKEDQGENIFKRRRSEKEKEEKIQERKIGKTREKSQLEDALIERIASNPKDTEAYERLGEYYFEIGNYDHSKECYKQVMKLSPGNFNARSRMRKLERMLGG